MTGSARLRAAVAATAIAGALLIAGCGGDDEPTATVAVTATNASPPSSATTTTGSGKHSGKTSTTQKSTTTKQGSSKAKTTTTGKKSSGTATTSKSAPSKKSSKSKKKAAPVHTVPIPPARTKVGKAQTFSGDGDKTLGTITLKRSSVVRWTSTGGSFALVDGAKKVSITGNAKSGQTFVAAGEYKSVKVTAKGHWTLSLAPLGN